MSDIQAMVVFGFLSVLFNICQATDAGKARSPAPSFLASGGPKMIRVYQITDADWYAGESGEACRAEYVKAVGDEEAKEYLAEFGEPIELTDEQLDKMTIVAIDEPGHPTQTFRQALEEVIQSGKHPCFIATTEY